MKKTICIFLIFFLLFGFAVPGFASTSSDVIPPVLDSTEFDSYIICFRTHYTGDSYACILFNSSDYYAYYKGDSSLVQLMPKSNSFVAPTRATVNVADYDNTIGNNGWSNFVSLNASYYNNNVTGEQQPYFNASTVVPSEGESILMSTVDIPYGDWSTSEGKLDITNEVFFSPTPPLVAAAEEALTQFQIQTSQTMMIILLCGVGCLALLISLPLLKRVFFQFLNR